jgi:hypothetical protein
MNPNLLHEMNLKLNILNEMNYESKACFMTFISEP